MRTRMVNGTLQQSLIQNTEDRGRRRQVSYASDFNPCLVCSVSHSLEIFLAESRTIT